MVKAFNKFTSKISNRIFLSTLLVIIIILLIQSFAYTFIIDDVHYISKSLELKSSFSGFIDELKDKNYDQEFANIMTEDYVWDTGNPIMIISPDELLYNEMLIPTYYHTLIVEKDNQSYQLVLTDDFLENINMETIDVVAERVSDNYYFPIILQDETYEDSLVSEVDITDETLLLEDATIVDFQLATASSIDRSLAVLIGLEYVDQEYVINNEDPIQSYNYEHIDVNANTVFYISHFYLNNELYYILTSDTIIGLREQLTFISSFNQFIFVIAFIIAIFVARIYAKSISKPMVELNDIALKMSQLDFSKKVAIQSNDEIGSLANSLNTMSTQLEKNINHLQEVNEALKHNYELKAKEEQRAKDLILHLSHELNTPLGIVSGFNEILSDGINDKDPEYYHKAITYELDRMKTLVSDMLELSVLESDDYELELDTISIKNIVEERLRHYKKSFEDKNITLYVSITDQNVEGNYRKMHQVINNFITNASKYTPDQGHFKIHELVTNDSVTYYFENTTQHVDDDLSLYWEKFYRTKKTNTRKEKGSGIGLSIAKEILELHQSDYGIEQTESGLRFYFKLRRL